MDAEIYKNLLFIKVIYKKKRKVKIKEKNKRMKYINTEIALRRQLGRAFIDVQRERRGWVCKRFEKDGVMG